jgi:hypothetical protein
MDDADSELEPGPISAGHLHLKAGLMAHLICDEIDQVLLR